MLTDFEKFIYNKHLSCSKKNQNKPYTLRKDFSNLDDSATLYVKKLSMFFNKFKHIDIEDFFNAPYKIYTDEKYFDLKFYISPKAINTYNVYKKQKEVIDPDSIESLQFTQSSLKFIKEYCKDKKISYADYLDFIDTGDTLPAFITHLQTHKINFYSLMGHGDLLKKIYRYYETYKFALGSVVENLEKIYNNFVRSKKLKILVREGIKKIS